MNRDTLITLIAAVTSGAALTVALSRRLKTNPDTRRYVEVIERQQAIFAIAERLNACVGVPYPLETINEIKKAVDDLTGYALDNFNSEYNLEVQYQIHDMLEGWIKIDALSVDDLKSILEGVVPVAVLRNVILHGNKYIHKYSVRNMPNFDEFAQRYKDMILGPCRSRPNADRERLYPEEWARRGWSSRQIA